MELILIIKPILISWEYCQRDYYILSPSSSLILLSFLLHCFISLWWIPELVAGGFRLVSVHWSRNWSIEVICIYSYTTLVTKEIFIQLPASLVIILRIYGLFSVLLVCLFCHPSAYINVEGWGLMHLSTFCKCNDAFPKIDLSRNTNKIHIQTK